jgi:quaternary ammonium compound-resistance protein SugE
MAWVQLLVAGILEIVWAIGMKYSAGFSRLWPSLITVTAALASFYYLSLALHTLPVGTAYAVWTGIGAVGTALLGILLFGESVSVLRLACILLIVCGILGLKWTA